MITPLGQRQTFQMANLEAVKLAHETAEQLQREQAQRQAADQRIADAKDAVHQIPRSENIRAEERREGGRGRGEGEARPDAGEEGPEEEAAQGEEAPARDAGGGHVDFLA